jgi:hypothetical protein
MVGCQGAEAEAEVACVPHKKSTFSLVSAYVVYVILTIVRSQRIPEYCEASGGSEVPGSRLQVSLRRPSRLGKKNCILRLKSSSSERQLLKHLRSLSRRSPPYHQQQQRQPAAW